MDPTRPALRPDISRTRQRPRGFSLLAAVWFGIFVAACSGAATTSSGSTPPGPDAIRVVATTTVVADLVREIGGENVAVESLVPKGGEVHTFDPRPSDVKKIADAQLIVANGLGLDDWLARFAQDAGARAAILRLAEGLSGFQYIDDPETGEPNPHAWLDPAGAGLYARRIADELARLAPQHAAAFDQRWAAFDDQLETLLKEGRSAIEAVPAEDRKLVSYHDALPYFARAFGLTIVGVVVPAPGQDPSAGEVAALVAAIKNAGVRVVVSEVQFNPDLANVVADETGATVIADFYTDTLGDPPVDTYLGLMRWDLELIVDGLR
jgi:ABC-type Zn uptake system ZnuABC Zn-binding protein ZnuA